MMKGKSSRTILYIIFATIGAFIFIYYLLDDKKLSIKKLPEKISTHIISEASKMTTDIIPEINLDEVKNIVSDAKFANILIN